MARSVLQGEASIVASQSSGLGGFTLFHQSAVPADVVDSGNEELVANTGATHHPTGSPGQLPTCVDRSQEIPV